AHSFDQCSPAQLAEGHVSAEAQRRLGADSAGPAQYGRRVGAAATQTPSDRNGFLDGDPGRAADEFQGSGHQIGLVLRHRCRKGIKNSHVVGRLVDDHNVIQGDREHFATDEVVAVAAPPGNFQVPGQLRRNSQANHRAAASRANSSRVNSSGRRVAAMSARSKTPSLTQPASERRSILRRWPNEVRMTSKSAASLTIAGSMRTRSWRTMDTSAESTFGLGRKTVGATLPTTCASAKYCRRSEAAP